MPGKGRMQITGKLGDVMQESVKAAKSFVRSKSLEYGIIPPLFEKKDFHIHVPEGATPKDGPSAGIAMVTSIVSSITNIPVNREIAMTGEITLRGLVLPIGGLKEKLLAAHRGGIKKVLIPEENLGLDRLLESLKRSEKSGKSSSIVVVAEGDKTGRNVFEIAEYVEKNMPYYDVRVSVLGHMQRGGSPSCFDRVLASRMGVYAVESLLEGKSNVMVGVKNEQMILSPLEKAIKGKSEINRDLIRVSDILTV